MEKIHRPTRLIGYDTEMNVKRRETGKTSIYKLLRARTLIYAILILAIGSFMSVTLATRGDLRLSVLHDRNPLSVRLADGGARNGYTARISNMKNMARQFTLSISGVEGAKIDVIGEARHNDHQLMIEIGPDQTREIRILVATHGLQENISQQPIRFTLKDNDTGARMETQDVFVRP